MDINIVKRERESRSLVLLPTYRYFIRIDDQEKLSPGMHCRVLMISSEEKNEREKRQSCEREGELSHFTFISIHF